jgi:hypothetical protein
MNQPLRFPRNILLGVLLEQFFVAAVSAILLIRFFLTLAGFPQVGGHGLHIAHMLWGGLLMLIALILLLAFLGRRIQHAAAVLGGIGFGTFIDELGKFITSDNNYFFQPAIAIIYAIFVLLFLVFRFLERPATFSERELLANALDQAKESILTGRRSDVNPQVAQYLRAAAPHSPLGAALAEMLMPAEQATSPGAANRVAQAPRRLYARLVQHSWFDAGLILVFVAHTVFALGTALAFIAAQPAHARFDRSDFVHISLLVVNGVVIALLLVGVLALHRSRLAAYLWFKRAILVSLLLAQFFQFYLAQLVAVIGLGVDLIVLSALNAMLAAERARREQPMPAQHRDLSA